VLGEDRFVLFLASLRRFPQIGADHNCGNSRRESRIERHDPTKKRTASLCHNCLGKDSAEKPYECFDEAQHERKISNDFTRSSVRPEALEG
jgi:hypothetical protein